MTSVDDRNSLRADGESATLVCLGLVLIWGFAVDLCGEQPCFRRGGAEAAEFVGPKIAPPYATTHSQPFLPICIDF